MSGLLTKDPNTRLGGGPRDALDVMAHQFFDCIDWDALVRKSVIPKLCAAAPRGDAASLQGRREI
ncbi:unnamed protein product [Protopolystoma xenopodis]|uniref:AGC-kinase C-terminal domain-containing protein n=1 Tax=Protopolystoma xenopodis TaxID=117903 RepID=A0A3S5ARZ8_9PLAT|nr:unnamed protein product [Protopolystoma xenopodis]